MTEKLSQFFSLLILLSIGLISDAQDKERGNQRKYYGEGGRELTDESEIRKEKAIVISQDGYRTFSYVGSVSQLMNSNNGKLPDLKTLKSDLGDKVSFQFGTMHLKMGPNDHSDLSYAKNMGTSRPIKKANSQANVDSIIGECSYLGNFLNYNLALAGLVDTSGSFFNDASKNLKLDVTIEKLMFKTCFNPYTTKAEATFSLDIKDLYGTDLFTEKISLETNLYEGSYAVLLLEDFECHYDVYQYAIRGFLLFDLFQALAFEISHSQNILNEVNNRATSLSGTAYDESLVIKSRNNTNKSINQLLEAVVTIVTDDGHGSGCLISEDGYIISNHHVAGVNNKKLQVILNDGSEYSAELVRSDAYSDLALLKISSDRKFGFLQTQLESNANLGDRVRVIGTPADPKLGQTLTAGIISSLRKNNKLDLIQTDAHISPGNSGGALINASGELIGIVSSKAMGIITEGIGFAIPVKYITERLNINFE